MTTAAEVLTIATRRIFSPLVRLLLHHGVSYQASVQGKEIVLKVGYANEIRIAIPEGVQAECPNPTHVIVTGPDKQAVGQFAAEIRSKRPPEPYNGKGIKYRDEHIIRKQGKVFGS